MKIRLPLFVLAMAAQTSSAQDLSGMTRYFDRIADFGVSGAVVVMKNSEVVYRHGFGWADRARRIPMTPASGVDIASLSKQMTAIAILQLEEKGLLRRADSIAAHLDSVPGDKRAITIQQLLTHRSGLPSYFIDGNDFTRLTRDEAERAIMRTTLEFRPGTGEGYSDAGFTLLAILVEKLSGKTVEAFMQREQFEVAGMRDTHAYGSPGLVSMSNLAHGYLGAEDRGTPASYVSSPDHWVIKGAGAVISTADDLATWEAALRRSAVISKTSTAAYYRASDSAGIAGEPLRLPSGRTANVITGAQDFGFATAIVRYVEDGTTVVLTMNRQPQAMDISFARNALVADVDAFLYSTGRIAPPVPTPGALPDTATYRLHDGSTIRVAHDGDFVVMFPDGPLAVDILGYGADTTGRILRLALSSRALAIVEGVCRGDTSLLDAALLRPSERYTNFIRTTACADSAARFTSTGSLPRWWMNPQSIEPATLVQITDAKGTRRFRIEWAGDRIGALGGGGMEPPATPFSFSDKPGELVGYHIGIRQPVRAVITPSSIRFPGNGTDIIAIRQM